MDYKATLKEIKALKKASRYHDALELTLALKQVAWNDPKLHRLINQLKPKLKKEEQLRRKQFIQESLQAIEKLKKEDQFESAIKGCRELLEVSPDEPLALRLLRDSKEAFIDQKLKDPLQKKWEEEKKYEKLYLFYLKLKKIFPEHPRVQKLLEDAERKVIRQDRERKQVFSEESLKKLQALFEQKQYETVIQGTQDLIRMTHAGSNEARKLLEKARKANWKEIERDTQEYLKKQTPILKESFLTKSEPMIKI